MKHYFVFILVIVVLVAADMVDGKLVKRVSIPHVKRLNLPFFAESKHFELSNINPTAFIPSSCQIVAQKEESEKVKHINLTLNMVYYSNGRAVCNINGKTLSVGGGFDGVRVIKIEKNRVLVSVNGKLKWLGVGVYATQKD